jgi:hypothetical protein
MSRSSSPAAASASRCHARHRGHIWPVSRANSSFSRVRSRERHEKRAAGHSLLHSLIALVSMVRSTTLNMQLGALRDQQQLRENCFLKMFVRSKLWKVADPLKQHKEPKVKARRACLESERCCHGAGWCQPPRARSLEPCMATCLKRGGDCEIGGAPTHHQMQQAMRGPARLVSMRGCHWVP